MVVVPKSGLTVSIAGVALAFWTVAEPGTKVLVERPVMVVLKPLRLRVPVEPGPKVMTLVPVICCEITGPNHRINVAEGACGVPRAPALPIWSVPPLMMTPPVKVLLALVSAMVPVPSINSLPVPPLSWLARVRVPVPS